MAVVTMAVKLVVATRAVAATEEAVQALVAAAVAATGGCFRA
jgi:hypothetical protein